MQVVLYLNQMGEFNFVDDGSMPGGEIFILFLFKFSSVQCKYMAFHIDMSVFVSVCFIYDIVLLAWSSVIV